MTAIAMAGVLGPGLPAQAKPSAAELKKEIAALNNQIEQNGEKYNGAEVKLQADQKLSTKLALEIEPLQLQAAVADEQLGSLAAMIYMSGGANHTLEALMDTASTATLLDELGLLNELARGQKEQINGAAALVKSYQDKKTVQDALVAKDKALVASLAATKKTFTTQLATLTKLQGEQGGGGGGGSGGGTLGSGPYTKAQIEPYPCPRVAGSGKGETAAVKACSLLWQPSKAQPWTMYKLTAPNSSYPNRYDCSGLTMTAWKAAGVTLNHFTGDQWKETAGSRPTRSTLETGDLVFYYSDHHHVAIYIGDGWIAEAEETGQPLKEAPIGSPSGYGRP